MTKLTATATPADRRTPHGLEVGEVRIARSGRIEARFKKAGKTAAAVARETKHLKAAAGAVAREATWVPFLTDAAGTSHPVTLTVERWAEVEAHSVNLHKREARKHLDKLVELGAMPHEAAVELYQTAFDGAVARLRGRWPESTLAIASAREID